MRWNLRSPSVSVVIPAYNQAELVPAAVESAFSQSRPEVVVVTPARATTRPTCARSFPDLAASEPLAVILSPLVRWRVGSHDSVIKPENTERLVRGALDCLERAARLRPLSKREQRAYEPGRKALWLRLAYGHLSNLDGRADRASLAEAFAHGVPRSPRALALLAAAFLPSPALRAFHWVKRQIG